MHYCCFLKWQNCCLFWLKQTSMSNICCSSQFYIYFKFRSIFANYFFSDERNCVFLWFQYLESPGSDVQHWDSLVSWEHNFITFTKNKTLSSISFFGGLAGIANPSSRSFAQRWQVHGILVFERTL